jgi:hypothetical protein
MINFNLVRDKDVSGVSGVGAVAEGVIFSNGKVVIAWNGAVPSVTIYSSIEDVDKIHGHEGSTRIVYNNAVDLILENRKILKQLDESKEYRRKLLDENSKHVNEVIDRINRKINKNNEPRYE